MSLDCLRNPQLRLKPIPFWNILILRAQIVIVYFFAGIAKISKDYLDGRQLRSLLISDDRLPFLQSFVSTEWGITLFVYSGLFIDLLIGFFLCYKPTRPLAFFVAVIFHITNKLFFDIDIFHHFMIATLILFVKPDEPRRLLYKILNFFKKTA